MIRNINFNRANLPCDALQDCLESSRSVVIVGVNFFFHTCVIRRKAKKSAQAYPMEEIMGVSYFNDIFENAYSWFYIGGRKVEIRIEVDIYLILIT